MWLLLALPCSDLRRASAVICLLLANYPDSAANAKAGDAKDYVSLPLLSDFVDCRSFASAVDRFRTRFLCRCCSLTRQKQMMNGKEFETRCMYLIANMESTSFIEEDNPKLPNKMIVHCKVSLICFMDSGLN
jgi:hypothetical protein